jgi:hypothetical protein
MRGTCAIGDYLSYAINTSYIQNIQMVVNFAQNTGIRLVIKNTGHDFTGKSGETGSLSIWTHHLKGIDFLPNCIENNGGGCVGPAFKM